MELNLDLLLETLRAEREEKKEELKELNITIKSVENTIKYLESYEDD